MEGERNEQTKRESFVLLWCARLCYVCCDRRRQWPIRLWRCGVRSFESLVKCQSKRPAKPILTGNVWTSPGCYLLVTHLFFFSFLPFRRPAEVNTTCYYRLCRLWSATLYSCHGQCAQRQKHLLANYLCRSFFPIPMSKSLTLRIRAGRHMTQ